MWLRYISNTRVGNPVGGANTLTPSTKLRAGSSLLTPEAHLRPIEGHLRNCSFGTRNNPHPQP